MENWSSPPASCASGSMATKRGAQPSARFRGLAGSPVHDVQACARCARRKRTMSGGTVARQSQPAPRHQRIKRYPSSIERRGDSIRVILHAGRGERHTFTLPTIDRREAEEFARRKHEELRRQAARWRRRGLGPTHISALLDQFEAERLPLKAPNTQTTYRASLARFREFFVTLLGDPLVHDIESDMVAEFLAWRRGHRRHGRAKPVSEMERRSLPPVTNRTLAKDRTTLHGLFAFAEELRLRDGNPVTRTGQPKADARTPVILTDAQFEKLRSKMAALSPMHELYVVLLGETGGRCESEALWLRWEDVDVEGGFLAIVSGRDGSRTKNGKTRYVPMTVRLRQALLMHRLRFKGATYDGQPSPWVFHHLTTRRHAVAGTRIVSLVRSVQGCRGAGGTAARTASARPAASARDDLDRGRQRCGAGEGGPGARRSSHHHRGTPISRRSICARWWTNPTAQTAAGEGHPVKSFPKIFPQTEKAAPRSGPKSLSALRGAGRNRTVDGGFADLCLTTWLRRRIVGWGPSPRAVERRGALTVETPM